MFGFILFVLLLIVFIVVMYRLFTMNSEDRNLVLGTIVKGSDDEAETEETDTDDTASHLRSSFLGSDMLKRSMWFGFNRNKNKTLPADTKDDTPGKDFSKLGVNGEFGDVVQRNKQDDSKKGKESGKPTKDNNKEFETDVETKPETFEAVSHDSKLEIKPSELSNARDNTKATDKQIAEIDEKADKTMMNKVDEEAKFKAILGNKKLAEVDAPNEDEEKDEKLIPEISATAAPSASSAATKSATKTSSSDLLENNKTSTLVDNKSSTLVDNKTSTLVDNKTSTLVDKKSDLFGNKKSDLKSSESKPLTESSPDQSTVSTTAYASLHGKKSHHHKKSNLKKSHLKKSHHHKSSSLKGKNMDLNTLLTSTKEGDLN